jgi:hypothetical protein
MVQAAAAQDTSKPAPKPPASSSLVLLKNWNEVGRKLIAMAEDFPEDKYDFKPNPVQGSFAEQILHAADENYYSFMNLVTGTKLPTGHPRRANYKTKAAVVEDIKESFADGAELIKSKGDAGMSELYVDPFANQQARFSDLAWGVIEQGGERYGQLVVYYRVAGLVPPESRPKVRVSSQVQPSQNSTSKIGKPTPQPQRAPYTATFKETIVSLQSKGRAAPNTTIVVEALDRQGRRVRSTSQAPWTGAKSIVTRISVHDPAAKNDVDWTVVSIGEFTPKQATVRSWPVWSAPRAPCPAPTPAPPPSTAVEAPTPDDPVARIHRALEDLRAQLRANPPGSENRRTSIKNVDLGTKTILGIEVHGHRSIITTTTGTGAKEVSIQDVRETWVDTTPGLGSIFVLQTNDDPRLKSSSELVSLTVGDPDPALFLPPADYEIVEQNPPGCPAEDVGGAKPLATQPTPTP